MDDKLKVLIVDNSLFIREKLKLFLEKAGCTVIAQAKDAKEAIEQYRQTKPDFVTMDIIMPKVDAMNGMGALTEILKIDPKAKIVMLTAVDQKTSINECRKIGAFDYLIKPLEQTAVNALVAKLS